MDIKYSKPQTEAKRQIEHVKEELGQDRWMTKNELTGVSQHTIDALVNKGFLEVYRGLSTDRVVGGIYFRIKIGD